MALYKLQNHSVKLQTLKSYRVVNRDNEIVSSVLAPTWRIALAKGIKMFGTNNVTLIS